MSSEEQVLKPNVQNPASIRGKVIVAVIFFAMIGAVYFFDLMAYSSLDVLKANRDTLLASTEEHD